MASLLRRLTEGVARRPVVTLLVLLLVTAVLVPLIPQGELTNDQAAFAPSSPEVDASNELAERFRSSSTATLQVIVRGDDVVGADGAATVGAVTRTAEEIFGDALASGPSGAVVSYLQGVVQQAEAQGRDPASLSDDEVDALQRSFLEEGTSAPTAPAPEGPPGGDPTALVRQLVGGEDVTAAPSGLVLVQLDRSAFDSGEDLVLAQQRYQAALAGADLPLETIPFSFELVSQPDDDFQQEVGRLFGLAALVILLVLAFVLRARSGDRLTRVGAVRRSLSDMAISIATVLVAITWTQGLLVLLGPDYVGWLGQASPPTQIVPVLLLALGVDYAIHAHARYREELQRGGGAVAVVGRLGGTVGVALFLSMFTTGIGFSANALSPIPAIRDLGVLAAVGIVCVFVLTLTFLPAVRVLLDRYADRRGRLVRADVAPLDTSPLSRLAELGVRPALTRPWAMLGVVAVLAGAGAYGLTQLDTVFSVTAFLPEDSPAKVAFETLAEDFGGGLAESTDVLVTGDVLTPEVHNAVATVPDELAGEQGVVQLGDRPDVTTPVTAIGRSVASVMAAPEGVEVTEDQRAAAAAAVDAGLRPDGTVDESTDVGELYRRMAAAFPAVAATVDVEGDPALKLSVGTQSDAIGAPAVQELVDTAVAPVEAAGTEATVTSDAIINDAVITSLAGSQVSGLVLTVLVVLLLLGAVYGFRDRRPLLGVLVVLPVAVVLLWVFGLMAATGIPFDPITAIMSALVVGVGVDFCIHLGERFVEDVAEEPDLEHALTASLRHTGAALAGAAFTTTAGFVVLTFASIVPFQRLGIVTIYAMLLSLLATIVVLPPLLVLYARNRMDLGGTAEPTPAPQPDVAAVS